MLRLHYSYMEVIKFYMISETNCTKRKQPNVLKKTNLGNFIVLLFFLFLQILGNQTEHNINLSKMIT